MANEMRKPTISGLGLGNVIDIFQNGKAPADLPGLVDKVFGEAGDRGAMVVSGANGIVGAGKMMQLGSRLLPFGVPVVGLDFPGSPGGLAMQYQGLKAGFGAARANEIMSNIIELKYDGKKLPGHLKAFKPRFLLEAIPEVLEIKKAHYKVFRESFPGVEIRSVTSGFPASELGVGIAHPAFPHQINKVWEIVEDTPSDITRLFWALGMVPIPVSDHWSFVLDVLFCGLALAAIRYHENTNMPYWKIDKYVRKLIGPNPFRAHDVIGAKGANFLTWSCLHHLNKKYGKLFDPSGELVNHKDNGQNWYPLNHLRPIVNWSMGTNEADDFEVWILGPLFRMTSIMLKENRAHLSGLNAIGELCAQFRRGILALMRSYGADGAIAIAERYQNLFPASADTEWYPDTFRRIESPEWQQLYVNAEHNGKVGVITIGRESYNRDVNEEMNRAIDWLKAAGIERVIVTGDFHLSTQLVGADTSEFYPALEDGDSGYDISYSWSKTARRLNNEFKTSVGFINGKRCLGGMLELLVHCHYVVSTGDAALGAPEVTLPVIPGMEMCHWPFRKTDAAGRAKLLHLLLDGSPVKAKDAVGWLVDYAGSMDESIAMAWKLASEGEAAMPARMPEQGSLGEIPADTPGIPGTDNPSLEAARKTIIQSVRESCGASIGDALNIQAKISADFMLSKFCREGFVGTDYKKTMRV